MNDLVFEEIVSDRKYINFTSIYCKNIIKEKNLI